MNSFRRLQIVGLIATSLMMPMIARAQPVPAPSAATCPCTCTIQTTGGTVTESVDIAIGSGSGQASTLAQATGKCTDTTTAGACSARSVTHGGTSFTGSLGACPASLFPGTAGETGATTGGTGDRVRLYNPLGTDIGVAEFISRAIRAIIGFIGALALLMFIYGGLMYMTAGGDTKKVSTAQDIIRNSTIGLLLIFFSYSIVATVFGLLGGT